MPNIEPIKKSYCKFRVSAGKVTWDKFVTINIGENVLLNNSNKSPTRCKNFSSLLLDVYVQLSMFRASSRPSSGAQQLQ